MLNLHYILKKRERQFRSGKNRWTCDFETKNVLCSFMGIPKINDCVAHKAQNDINLTMKDDRER